MNIDDPGFREVVTRWIDLAERRLGEVNYEDVIEVPEEMSEVELRKLADLLCSELVLRGWQVDVIPNVDSLLVQILP